MPEYHESLGVRIKKAVSVVATMAIKKAMGT
jgi:hypothetical protein